ncbi:MAG: hypothetical protein HRU41_11025 [Saprospiraceae bacterium]|nr:hypothetical protein [Saprospiraceae bacterium]
MERRDQLEEFVKNQLSHYEEQPSDGLWRRIEGLIPMPKPAAKPPWFWGLLGALLLLGGIVIWHFYSVKQWKEKVEEQEIAIQELWSELESLQGDVLTQKTTTNEQVANSTNSTSVSKTTKVTSAAAQSYPSSFSDTPKQKVAKTGTYSEEDETKPLTPLKTHTVERSTQVLNETSISQLAVPALNPLESKGNLTELQDPLVDLQPIALSPIRTPRWSVGAWMEGTNFHDNPLNALWRRAGRAEDASGDTPSFYANNPSSTNTLGFFLDFDLNRRWSIRTGLGIKDQRRPLGGDFVFAYTLEDSQMNALGHSASPYNYYDEGHNISIRTIIANELSNEPNGLEPGELFEMDFAAYQQTLYVSFPLWLSYRMGNGRLKYHLRTGMVWNDLIGNSSKIRYLSFSFSQLYYQGHAINDGTIQVGYLDVGLGYGVEYALSPKFGVYFDGVMYKSVTPIFDRQPFSLGMGGGLRYRL